MWTLGDALEGAGSFVRESGAARVAALWALAAFVVAAILIRRRQDNFGLKLGASLLAFGAAAGWLLWWSGLPKRMTYYKHVDEAVAEAKGLRLRRADVQVRGCVLPGSIERRVGTDEYRFRIKNCPSRPPAVIEAYYTGLVPDAFRSNAEIVAQGTLDADGRLDIAPDGVMTRCPGKYDADNPPDWQCREPG